MKLILSKRLCQKHLIRVEQINQLHIGDLFIRKLKGWKLSNCPIYIFAAVGFCEYALINVQQGTRILDPVLYDINRLTRSELKELLPKLGITSETYKIRE